MSLSHGEFVVDVEHLSVMENELVIGVVCFTVMERSFWCVMSHCYGELVVGLLCHTVMENRF